MTIRTFCITERTRAIGIRRAIGAKRIISQCLVEKIVLSTIGRLIGIGVGVLILRLITYSSGMPTVVTPESIVLPVIISAGIGIVFGLFPEMRAANVDPIIALGHE